MNSSPHKKVFVYRPLKQGVACIHPLNLSQVAAQFSSTKKVKLLERTTKLNRNRENISRFIIILVHNSLHNCFIILKKNF